QVEARDEEIELRERSNPANAGTDLDGIFDGLDGGEGETEQCRKHERAANRIPLAANRERGQPAAEDEKHRVEGGKLRMKMRAQERGSTGIQNCRHHESDEQRTEGRKFAPH